MLLNLSDLADESLQNQIIRQVRARILTGEVTAEQPLPSIRAMSRQNRVSVITVQRAYEALLREGLIHSRRGKGFFVASIPRTEKRNRALERLIDSLSPLLDAAIAEGLTLAEIKKAISMQLNNKERSGD